MFKIIQKLFNANRSRPWWFDIGSKQTDKIVIEKFCRSIIYMLSETEWNQNGEPSIFLLPIFFLRKIQVALKSLCSFCDKLATSSINNELKASAPHSMLAIEHKDTHCVNNCDPYNRVGKY